ncbi:alpha/beta fold hydrolase [Pseudoduganella violaceinigra]|uniref:alpha/beta fold hydrolase n=1 Tax=Pseudoduganella violaceinigra TaxID=246602 RepID=UPI000406CD2E|nr:alpha/beta hydrolase [Pseudoduganella violaceinigra]
MFFLYALGGAVLALAAADRLLPAPLARAALALERKRSGLVAKQGSLPYLEGGCGSEVLLLVHGFAGDKDNFTRIARLLVPHYRVIIPDLPGFGDARRDPNAKHDMATQVENLRTFMAELGVQRFHMGGNSMGGFISAEYASRHPEQVKSLWLLAPAGTEETLDSPAFRQYLAGNGMPLLVPEPGAFDTMMAACMAKAPYFPYSLKHVLARRAVADYTLHCALMKELHASPHLRGPIDTPALIVWGTEDRILSPKGAPATKALLPNARLIMMEGIGHLPMLESTRRAARDFLEFQQSIGSDVS